MPIRKQIGGMRSAQIVTSGLYDSFNGSGDLDSNKWNVYDPDSETALSVSQNDGQYQGVVTGAGNTDTTWFDTDEGVLHYVTMTGDFEMIARNIGILSGSDPGTEFQFAGLMVWLSAGNYEFTVVGNRGTDATNTHENKATVSSSSAQNDEGTNSAWSDRSDLRVTRVGSTVTFYRQQPGTSPDSWATNDHASLSQRVSFGTGAVRVGLITYGFSFPTNFTSACDQVEIPVGSPVV